MTENGFRLPDIKGSDAEQLRRIRSYLYQLVPQLELALNPQDGNETAAHTASVGTAQRESARPYNLGLSTSVLAPANEKAYCRCRTDGTFVALTFCVALPALPSPDAPVCISARPLPVSCRPSAPVYAVCYAEFLCADGETVCGTVGMRVTADGVPEIVCACAGGGEVVTVSKVQGTVCFA